MAPIVFNNLFKGSFLATATNFVLLILCLYPVVGAFFWFTGSLSYRFLKANKRVTIIGEICLQKSSRW